MANLHVHVLSPDRVSDALKSRKHYNSFSTPFFVPLADLPLAADDERRWPGKHGWLKAEMRCWRCGKKMEDGWRKMKGHLEEEFEEWKKV
ncbi:hypothetical protein BDY21DRAFT_356687 [Lineolata rhizophorae]|uniref:Aprataxin C2HE/C2H2/C2HC zinc finger domain-containing protein n=1 Tax=Lineolata rhizophorae TaxID=578093 RepID=A0A6A6NNB7_9PEZI|nr:hypothetical protein BDY21DRAFT_356687 [Lineolata rhizophorae]